MNQYLQEWIALAVVVSLAAVAALRLWRRHARPSRAPGCGGSCSGCNAARAEVPAERTQDTRCAG
ncbi:MAG: FeoB-associated Cys-rich membrane protein [Gammaproteobacteria bacterium]|nr:FeoB-associated Cys-rich membrane protein [Gammaproteobacteria bacterium]